MTRGQSDPLIVVGDGRADHMAKGRAEEQRVQSTHAWRGKLRLGVSNSLRAIWAVGKDLPSAEQSVTSGSNYCRYRCARSFEEPGAGTEPIRATSSKPHAGICEGAAGQPAVLPQ